MENKTQTPNKEIGNLSVNEVIEHYKKQDNKEIVDLLAPRFKVIADYPNSPYDLNQILTKREIRFGMGSLSPEHYPAIFKPLSWWEDREPHELPKYVKQKKDGVILKLLDSSQDGRFWHDDNEIELGTFKRLADNYIPATEQEYLSYIESKK